MRGVLLIAVALGSPMLIMAAVWRWSAPAPTDGTVATPSVMGDTDRPSPDTTPSTRELPLAEERDRPDDPSGDAPALADPLNAPHTSELLLADLTDAVDAWAARWRASAGRKREPTPDHPHELLADRRYDQALRAFDERLLRDPDDPDILMGKALALIGLNRPDDAVPLFEAILTIEPDHQAARFNYAVALTRTADLDAARRNFERLLARHPDHARAGFNLATLHHTAGRWHEALALWRRLTHEQRIDTGPDQAAAVTGSTVPTRLSPTALTASWFHRGHAALELHRNDEAEQAFLQVIARDPTDARAWCNLGIARAGMGRRGEALDALEEALRLDPRLVPALNQTALIHAATFRATQDESLIQPMIDLCNRSLALHPGQENLIALRAALRARLLPDWQPEDDDEP